ncbi:MAG: hypothetical protein GX216_03330 [Methanomicrobiales archaeon]|jgi:hypothetical protein|nr:hypothetical protein [Methanomicrobiales archaeon]
MVDYDELADIADRLFEESDDDDELLADALDTLDEETRDALLRSDLLNAYQVFYYYFRERPSRMAMERLQLSAASDLAHGIIIDEIDIYEVVFYQKESDPGILLTDGEAVQARFSGRGAYREMTGYLDEWF